MIWNSGNRMRYICGPCLCSFSHICSKSVWKVLQSQGGFCVMLIVKTVPSPQCPFRRLLAARDPKWTTLAARNVAPRVKCYPHFSLCDTTLRRSRAGGKTPWNRNRGHCLTRKLRNWCGAGAVSVDDEPFQSRNKQQKQREKKQTQLEFPYVKTDWNLNIYTSNWMRL